VRELGLVLEEGELLRGQERAVREVEQVRERELVAREVLLLGEDRLVARELALERLRELGNARLVRRAPAPRDEHALVRDPRRERVEVGGLDRRGLLEQRGLVRVARREQRRRGLRGDVARHRARLEYDEPIVLLRVRSARADRGAMWVGETHEVGHLPERLLGEERGRLLLALHQVDGDELERRVRLLQHRRDALRARRDRAADECEDHGGSV
jgi:hypothetical protein